MNSLSSTRMVDQMVSELAERRRTASSRRAAYLALARAIVGDEQPELVTSAALSRQPLPLDRPALAA